MLTPVSGFLAEAGFTHSLTPARNCTFGCTYCYVPTLRVYGGLKREDWERWGQFTTFKPALEAAVRREARAGQRIYCSPLVDPYQPAEANEQAIRGVLQAFIEQPVAALVIQTRGPLILRDLPLLQQVPNLRVSFSITTDNDVVRARYEPRCATIEQRWQTIARLREAGVSVHATLAPLLPCDPERLMQRALDETAGAVIADPFHTRQIKRRGATTREAALKISAAHGEEAWHDAEFQASALERMARVARRAGRAFGVGPQGFGLLAETPSVLS